MKILTHKSRVAATNIEEKPICILEKQNPF